MHAVLHQYERTKIVKPSLNLTPRFVSVKTTLGIVLAAIFALACAQPAEPQAPKEPEQSTAKVPAAPAASAPTSAPSPIVTGLPDFTPLVEKVGSSVVNIRVMERVERNPFSGRGNDPMEELLRRFFGIRPEQMPRPRRQQPESPRQERPTGVGSGFVMSSDGYIMTNAHVVDSADSLIVTLADKREFRGKVVGKDKRTDVAVVKIEAENLQPVHIGKVDQLKVGEWVVAIGSPFGLENTVTAGIVSAKQRDTGDYLPFIQTDVAINPGNSGGPLINMAGEVVGINSQIYSRSGGFMGISFSIPIDEAMRIADQLRATGTVTRGRIGVRISPVSKEVAEAMGLSKAQGALVSSVEKGAPADKAGLLVGDIITKVDGKAIERVSDLPRLIGSIKPGTQSTFSVLRNGKNKDVAITIGATKGSTPKQGLLEQSKKEDKSSASNLAKKMLGLDLAELSDKQRQDMNIPAGVLVRAVAIGSRAERAGLRADDVIVSLNKATISSVAAFETVLRDMPTDKPVAVLVQRDGLAHYSVIRP